jgi:hypothetical protein
VSTACSAGALTVGIEMERSPRLYGELRLAL